MLLFILLVQDCGSYSLQSSPLTRPPFSQKRMLPALTHGIALIFTLISIIRFLYVVCFYSLISPYLLPSLVPLYSFPSCKLSPLPLSFFIAFVCTLPHSNERYRAVVKLLCLICVTHHHVSRCIHFPNASNLSLLLVK